MKILVTGGAGYIGSHTILELFEQNFEEIYSIDNYLNSDESNYGTIKSISNKEVNYYSFDLNDSQKLSNFFDQHKIDVVVHFAALKSVPESVEEPTIYYKNNMGSLLNLLECMDKHGINKLIFSSSCSVYGNPEELPVNESSKFGKAESPYARTKQFGELIIEDFCKVKPKFKAISLRYFNPVGAHKSGLIGEGFTKKPNNLVPIITQTAIGLREDLTVFGDDYNTLDGSCIRDYIHVSDIADAHVRAIQHFKDIDTKNYQVINLGTGNGSSVIEVIRAFEKVSGKKLNYKVGNRRAGDIEAIYANNDLAFDLLDWKPSYSLEAMLSSAWKWQEYMMINGDISHLSES